MIKTKTKTKKTITPLSTETKQKKKSFLRFMNKTQKKKKNFSEKKKGMIFMPKENDPDEKTSLKERNGIRRAKKEPFEEHQEEKQWWKRREVLWKQLGHQKNRE